MDHYRDFNYEHALYGASFNCYPEMKFGIVTMKRPGSFYDRYPILLIDMDTGETHGFSRDGHSPTGHKKLVMTPVIILNNKPVFTGDKLECRSSTNGQWVEILVNTANVSQLKNWILNNLRWPKRYPKTRMSPEELKTFYDSKVPETSTAKERLLLVANEVLKQAIEAGDILVNRDN